MQIDSLKPPKEVAGLRPCYDHDKFIMVMTVEMTRNHRSMTGTEKWEYIKYPKPIVSLKYFFYFRDLKHLINAIIKHHS